jgi:hypothetical protein
MTILRIIGMLWIGSSIVALGYITPALISEVFVWLMRKAGDSRRSRVVKDLGEADKR